MKTRSANSNNDVQFESQTTLSQAAIDKRVSCKLSRLRRHDKPFNSSETVKTCPSLSKKPPQPPKLNETLDINTTQIVNSRRRLRRRHQSPSSLLSNPGVEGSNVSGSNNDAPSLPSNTKAVADMDMVRTPCAKRPRLSPVYHSIRRSSRTPKPTIFFYDYIEAQKSRKPLRSSCVVAVNVEQSENIAHETSQQTDVVDMAPLEVQCSSVADKLIHQESQETNAEVRDLVSVAEVDSGMAPLDQCELNASIDVNPISDDDIADHEAIDCMNPVVLEQLDLSSPMKEDNICSIIQPLEIKIELIEAIESSPPSPPENDENTSEQDEPSNVSSSVEVNENSNRPPLTVITESPVENVSEQSSYSSKESDASENSFIVLPKQRRDSFGTSFNFSPQILTQALSSAPSSPKKCIPPSPSSRSQPASPLKSPTVRPVSPLAIFNFSVANGISDSVTRDASSSCPRPLLKKRKTSSSHLIKRMLLRSAINRWRLNGFPVRDSEQLPPIRSISPYLSKSDLFRASMMRSSSSLLLPSFPIQGQRR